MCLHRAWIGRWLARKAGGLFCAPEVRTQALRSTRELALIMHRLNQLHLSAGVRNAHGFMMSLAAINMAEASGSAMPSEQLVEIYLTAALRAQRHYPKFAQFFARYYLRKARQVADSLGSARLPEELGWAFTAYGYNFLSTQAYTGCASFARQLRTATPATSSSVAVSSATEPDGSGDSAKSPADNGGEPSLFIGGTQSLAPLDAVRTAYREHLLEKALQSLCGTGTATSTSKRAKARRAASLKQQQQQQLLKQKKAVPAGDGKDSSGSADESSSSNSSLPTHRTSSQLADVLVYTQLLAGTGRDELARWWSALFAIAALWRLGEDAEAERLYAEVEQRMPEQLRNSSGGVDGIGDPLPRTMLQVFRVKRSLLQLQQMQQQPPNTRAAIDVTEELARIFARCNTASQGLEDSVTGNKIRSVCLLKLVSKFTGYSVLFAFLWLDCLRAFQVALHFRYPLTFILSINNPQFVQLLACDWLLECRQTHWEAEHAGVEFDGFWPVSSMVLEKFQRDLNALRTVIDDLAVSFEGPYLISSLLFVFRLNSTLTPVYHLSHTDRTVTRVLVRGRLPCDGWCLAGRHAAAARPQFASSARSLFDHLRRRRQRAGTLARWRRSRTGVCHVRGLQVFAVGTAIVAGRTGRHAGRGSENAGGDR